MRSSRKSDLSFQRGRRPRPLELVPVHQSVPPVSDEAKRLAGIATSWLLGQQLSAITGVIPTGDDPALSEAFAYAGRKLEGSPASEDPSPEVLLATITQDDLPRLVNLAAVLCFGNPLFKLTRLSHESFF